MHIKSPLAYFGNREAQQDDIFELLQTAKRQRNNKKWQCCYDLFSGSGSMGLRAMALELAECYVINDAYPPLAHFWKAVKENPKELNAHYRELLEKYRECQEGQQNFFEELQKQFNSTADFDSHLIQSAAQFAFIINHAKSYFPLIDDTQEGKSILVCDPPDKFGELDIDRNFEQNVEATSTLFTNNVVSFTSENFRTYQKEIKSDNLFLLDPPYPDMEDGKENPRRHIYHRTEPKRELKEHLETFLTGLKNEATFILFYGVEGMLNEHPLYDVYHYLRLSGGRNSPFGEYVENMYVSKNIARLLRAIWKSRLIRYDCQLDAQIKAPGIKKDSAEIAQWLQGQISSYEEWNQPFHNLFEAKAKKTPWVIALVNHNEQKEKITYEELNKKANQLAHYLLDQGLKTGNLVAILVNNQWTNFIISILAVLKIGAAYVPIDACEKEKVIRDILSNSDAKFCISLGDVSHIKLDKQIHVLNTLRDDTDPNFDQNPEISNCISPDDLAYVMYTSGSTGNPKGAAILHRGLPYCLKAHQKKLALQPNDQIAQMAKVGFDASLMEIMMALGTGATLHIVPPNVREDNQALADLFRQEKITHAILVPSKLKTLEQQCTKLPDLKGLVVIGEAFNESLIKPWHDAKKIVVNGYGLTETTICTTLEKYKENGLTIGKPIIGTSTYVFPQLEDELSSCAQLTEVKEGGTGELYVGGASVASHYLNDEQNTKKRFIPFKSGPDSILYRTGDLVKKLPERKLEFMGRVDNQIKLRGQRLEPEHVEAVLRDYKVGNQCLIQKACVVGARENDHVHLVAYLQFALFQKLKEQTQDAIFRKFCTFSKFSKVDPWASKVVENLQNLSRRIADEGFSEPFVPLSCLLKLRKYLQEKLPGFMVPNAMAVLLSLPLNGNEKLQREELKAKRPLPFLRNRFGEDPQTQAEKALAGIWGKLLGIDKIKRDDDFLYLGGNSLNFSELLSQLRADSLFKRADSLTAENIYQYSALKSQARRACYASPVKRHYQGESHFPPIIFLHSLLGNGWDEYGLLVNQLKSLKGSLYALKAPMLENEEEKDNDIHELVLHYVQTLLVEALLPSTALQEVILIGWSSGGLLALEMARQLKERGYSPALVIIDSKFITDPQIRQQHLAALLDEKLGETSQRNQEQKRQAAFASWLDQEEQSYLAQISAQDFPKKTFVVLSSETQRDLDLDPNKWHVLGKKEGLPTEIIRDSSHFDIIEKSLPCLVSFCRKIIEHHQLQPLIKQLKESYSKKITVKRLLSNDNEETPIYLPVTLINKQNQTHPQIIAFENLALANRDYHWLIQGVTGSGKTLLTYYLAQQWAQGNLWQAKDKNIKTVLRINLRVLVEMKTMDLVEVIHQNHVGLKLDRAQITQLLAYSNENVVWILDGLDEVASFMDEPGPVNEVLNELLQQPRVIVTSCLGYSQKLSNYLATTNANTSSSLRTKQFEIDINDNNTDQSIPAFMRTAIHYIPLMNIGFSDENINKYIEKYIEEKIANNQQREQGKSLMDMLASHDENLLRTPMVLGLSCELLTQAIVEKKELSEQVTRSVLYQSITERLSNQWQKNCGEPHAPWIMHPYIKEAVQKSVELLAYNALVYSQRGVVRQDLIDGAVEEIVTRYNNNLTDKSLPSMIQSQLISLKLQTTQLLPFVVKKSGFLHENTSSTYEFIHLSVQEYLGAKYVSQLPSSEISNFLSRTADKKEYEELLIFLAALLNTPENSEKLKKYFDYFLEQSENYSKDAILQKHVVMLRAFKECHNFSLPEVETRCLHFLFAILLDGEKYKVEQNTIIHLLKSDPALLKRIPLLEKINKELNSKVEEPTQQGYKDLRDLFEKKIEDWLIYLSEGLANNIQLIVTRALQNLQLSFNKRDADKIKQGVMERLINHNFNNFIALRVKPALTELLLFLLKEDQFLLNKYIELLKQNYLCSTIIEVLKQAQKIKPEIQQQALDKLIENLKDVHGESNLYLMLEQPNDKDFFSYKGNYIWIRNCEKLYYVQQNEFNEVKLNDITLFKELIQKHNDSKPTRTSFPQGFTYLGGIASKDQLLDAKTDSDKELSEEADHKEDLNNNNQAKNSGKREVLKMSLTAKEIEKYITLNGDHLVHDKELKELKEDAFQTLIDMDILWNQLAEKSAQEFLNILMSFKASTTYLSFNHCNILKRDDLIKIVENLQVQHIIFKACDGLTLQDLQDLLHHHPKLGITLYFCKQLGPATWSQLIKNCSDLRIGWENLQGKALQISPKGPHVLFNATRCQIPPPEGVMEYLIKNDYVIIAAEEFLNKETLSKSYTPEQKILIIEYLIQTLKSKKETLNHYFYFYRKLAQQHDGNHKYFYDRLLEQKDLNSQAIEETLGCYPDFEGKRRVTRKKQKAWEKMLQNFVYTHQGSVNDVLIRSIILGGRELYPLASNIVKWLNEEKYLVAKGDFNLLHSKSLSHNHLVFSLEHQNQSIHCKVFPEHPGVEMANQILHEFIAGQGTCMKDLWLWKSGNSAYPALVSQTVKGKTVTDALKNDQKALDQLEMKSFSLRVLAAILINPEDGDPDNEILETYTDAQGQQQKRLISVANGCAFVLYCCRQMLNPIYSVAREEFLALDPKAVIENWLDELERLESHWQKIFQEYREKLQQLNASNSMQYTNNFYMLKKRSVEEVFEKFFILQDALITEPEITLINLLARVYPSLANVSRAALKDISCDSPLNRFEQIAGKEPFRNLANKEYYLSTNLIGIPQTPYLEEDWQQDLKQARSDLKKISQDCVNWAEVRMAIYQGSINLFDKLPTDFHKEGVINKLAWRRVNELMRQEVFRSIQGVAFKTLELNDCTTLQDNVLYNILQASKNLLSLDISRCSALTDVGLQERILPLLFKHPTLMRLHLNDLDELSEIKAESKFIISRVNSSRGRNVVFPNLRELSAGSKFIISTVNSLRGRNVVFPNLRELSTERCPNLTSLILNAPKLERLFIGECKALQQLDCPKGVSIIGRVDTTLSNNNKPSLLMFSEFKGTPEFILNTLQKDSFIRSLTIVETQLEREMAERLMTLIEQLPYLELLTVENINVAQLLKDSWEKKNSLSKKMLPEIQVLNTAANLKNMPVKKINMVFIGSQNRQEEIVYWYTQGHRYEGHYPIVEDLFCKKDIVSYARSNSNFEEDILFMEWLRSRPSTIVTIDKINNFLFTNQEVLEMKKKSDQKGAAEAKLFSAKLLDEQKLHTLNLILTASQKEYLDKVNIHLKAADVIILCLNPFISSEVIIKMLNDSLKNCKKVRNQNYDKLPIVIAYDVHQLYSCEEKYHSTIDIIEKKASSHGIPLLAFNSQTGEGTNDIIKASVGTYYMKANLGAPTPSIYNPYLAIERSFSDQAFSFYDCMEARLSSVKKTIEVLLVGFESVQEIHSMKVNSIKYHDKDWNLNIHKKRGLLSLYPHVVVLYVDTIESSIAYLKTSVLTNSEHLIIHKIPIVVVGKTNSLSQKRDIQEFANAINALAYIECATNSNENGISFQEILKQVAIIGILSFIFSKVEIQFIIRALMQKQSIEMIIAHAMALNYKRVASYIHYTGSELSHIFNTDDSIQDDKMKHANNNLITSINLSSPKQPIALVRKLKVVLIGNKVAKSNFVRSLRDNELNKHLKDDTIESIRDTIGTFFSRISIYDTIYELHICDEKNLRSLHACDADILIIFSHTKHDPSSIKLPSYLQKIPSIVVNPYMNPVGCDLVRMSSSPTKETLQDLQITSKAAYVRSGDKLFYVNKTNRECIEIKLDKEKLETFDKKLKANNEAKTLLEVQIKEITSITGHTHPVNNEEKVNFIHHIGAIDYVECDTKTDADIQKIFEAAVKATFLSKILPKKQAQSFIKAISKKKDLHEMLVQDMQLGYSHVVNHIYQKYQLSNDNTAASLLSPLNVQSERINLFLVGCSRTDLAHGVTDYISLDNRIYKLKIWERLTLSYLRYDNKCILLLIDSVQPERSFAYLGDLFKVNPDLKNIPSIVVGDMSAEREVYERNYNFSNNIIGAIAYLECSVGKNLKEVFLIAARIALLTSIFTKKEIQYIIKNNMPENKHQTVRLSNTRYSLTAHIGSTSSVTSSTSTSIDTDSWRIGANY